MKLFNSFVVLMLFFYAPSVLPTSVNGRFIVLDINSSKITVLLQINTDTGTDDLGGATIVFGFDTTAICFTSNPVKNVDYVSHTFCGGSYSPATVTRPMKNQIWVNIDLPFNNNNHGTLVAASPEWTDIVTIYFDVVDPNGTANLFWFSTSSFWGIYDADNATLWEVGRFEDLVTPLPVELSSFTAVFSDGTVQLKWITETEVNNYGFDIERKVEKQEWTQIGFLAGYGNSNSPKTYSFTDNNLIGGSKFQYRLKQIDTDGQYKYSETIEVEISPGNFTLYQNYPNPFNPSNKNKIYNSGLIRRDVIAMDKGLYW
ncbi:MAG: hypothetical protein U5J96_04260 [Ignavibacteriaceae bacterium]|nr:hypothetical protein [Ignavibacteriaceae bacterium]